MGVTPEASSVVRIGCVRYLNTVPLVHGLSAWRDARVVAEAPARLIDLLLGEEVDLALCSVIDAARWADRTVVVPVGMIGCDGPTLTVRLYSERPFAEISRLHADVESHTSVALARVILAESFGVRSLEVVEFDAGARKAAAGGREGAGDGWPGAVLLIGDKVITDSPPAGRYPHVLDLGQAWKARTGMPFVYAVWMARAKDVKDQGPARARLEAAAAVLERARLHNRTRLDSIVAASALQKGWPVETAREYLGRLLRYGLGESELAGMVRFLDEASRHGQCPPASSSDASASWATRLRVLGGLSRS